MELPKATEGEHFEGLDLLTALLAKRPPARGPVIEVLDSTSTPDEADSPGAGALGGAGDEGDEDDVDAMDWELDQELPNSQPSLQGWFVK